MADERDDDRDRENALIFRGTAPRGEMFDSLDSLVWAEEPAAAEPDAIGAPGEVDEGDELDADELEADDRPTADDAPLGDERGHPVGEGRDRFVEDGDVEDGEVEVGAGPTRTSLLTTPPGDARPTLRRRVLTAVAVVLAVLGTYLIVFPFDVTAAGVTAECGPPVYEVLVPPDAAFDGPENALCGSPAQHRLILGVVLVVAFLVVAFGHQWTERATKRRARRARRARAKVAAGRAPGRPAPSSGSGSGDGPATGTDEPATGTDEPATGTDRAGAADESVPAGPPTR